METKWYALRSKPRKEDIVWRQAHSTGLETFYPRVRVKPVNPRSKKIKPYFPGYLFIKVNLEDEGMSTFRWMPHTYGLVSFGGEPSHVPENLIIALKKKITEIEKAGGESLVGLKKGERVIIHDGPFSDYEAIFDERIAGKERVRVLLELLADRRLVPLELADNQISAKKN